MFQAVTFDLDGTLIDSTEAIVDSFNHTFDTIGDARPSLEAIVETISLPLEDSLRQLSPRDTATLIPIFRAYYEEIAAERTFLLPGVEEALSRLSEAGMPIGLATSKLRKFAEMLLDHFGVLRYFECRIGPDDVAKRKPHPEALLKAAAGLGVAPASMVYVGDSPIDVEASRRAGCPCLCVTTGYGTREELEDGEPEGVFVDLEAVTSFILSRNGRE